MRKNIYKKLHVILVQLILSLIFLFIGNHLLANSPKGLVNQLTPLKFLYITITAISISFGICLTLSTVFMVLKGYLNKVKEKK